MCSSRSMRVYAGRGIIERGEAANAVNSVSLMTSSSFLDKLKKRGFEEEEATREEQIESGAIKIPEGEMQLDVDLLQTSSEVVLITQIGGVQLKDVSISIEGENDVVVLQGEKKRPRIGTDEPMDEDAKFIHQEGHWGSFYRRVLLPGEIIPGDADAELEDGVLILRLPLAEPSSVSGQTIKIHRRESKGKKGK